MNWVGRWFTEDNTPCFKHSSCTSLNRLAGDRAWRVDVGSLRVDESEEDQVDSRSFTSSIIPVVSTVVVILGSEFAKIIDLQVASIVRVIDALFSPSLCSRISQRTIA